MLARRARGIDLSDGHSLLAALVSALARPRSTDSNSTSSSSSTSRPRSYSATTSTATTSGSPPARRQAQQHHGEGSRRRFCDLSREQRSVDRRDAGFEGPVASTSAITLDSPATQLASEAPPPPPAAVVQSARPKKLVTATTAPHLLLNSARLAHRSSPNSSPTDLISSQRPTLYDDDGDPKHPPTPPPPIAFLPEPSRPNPHMLSAFLLQAIFLGASALGLLTRRKVRSEGRPMGGVVKEEAMVLDERAVQIRWAKHELDRRRAEGEFAVDDVPSLNLLLSSHAELDPVMEAEWRKDVPKQQRTSMVASWDRRRSSQLSHVSSLLARFDKINKPDHWTVLAVLAFAQPAVVLPNALTSQSPFAQAQPLLTQWAWKAFIELDDAPSLPIDTCHAILRAFFDFLTSSASASLPPATREEIFSGVSDRLLLPSPTPSPPDLLLQLGLFALSARRTSTLTILLGANSPLPARERSELALATLEASSVDHDWRKNREAVQFLAQSMVTATEELCREGVEGVDASTVERAVRLLVTGFGVDVPLEPYASALVIAPLLDSATFFSAPFLPFILESLVSARQPALAHQILSLIPRSLRTTEHYYAILRSHHQSISGQAWHALQKRWAAGELGVEVEAWENRMAGLLRSVNGAGAGVGLKGSVAHVKRARAQQALDIALGDLDLLCQHGLTRSTKLSNTLLRLVSKASDDPAWRRQLGKAWRDGEVIASPGGEEETTTTRRGAVAKGRPACKTKVGSKTDKATQAIVLGRVLEGRPEDARGVQRGRKQMKAVREELGKLDGMLQRRSASPRLYDSEEKDDKTNVLPNIVLKSITRWPREVGTSTIVTLAQQTLSIDLDSADHLPLTFSTAKPSYYSRVRRPAYRTLLKALRNRGEHHYHDRLMKTMREEESRIRDTWLMGKKLEQDEAE